MTVIEYILSFLRDNPHILGLLLAIAVIFLEDTAIIAAAVLSAGGEISVFMALLSLFGGILVGEIICYYIGYLARDHKWLRNIMQRQGMSNALRWLEKNLILAVLAARYVPGMRVAIYGAMGYYSVSIRTILLTSLAVMFVWAGGLFFIVRKFGMQYWEDLGPAHWVVVVAFAAMLAGIYYTIQRQIKKTIEKKQKK